MAFRSFLLPCTRQQSGLLYTVTAVSAVRSPQPIHYYRPFEADQHPRSHCANPQVVSAVSAVTCVTSVTPPPQILKSELPPPAGIVSWLLTIGFLYAAFWAGKEALQRDASRSTKVCVQ